MDNLIFLGTGPAKGTKERMESSAIFGGKINILIDVTRFFGRQKKLIKNIDAVLITHGHQDAIGGIPQLNRWLKKKVTLYSHPVTIKHIKNKFKKTDRINFQSVLPYQKFKIADLEITPLPVKHSLQKSFPTYGYFIEKNKKSLAYVSDVSYWDKKTEKYLKKAKTLVIDGAMWEKKIAPHLTIKEILPKICRFSNKRIFFTQIGKTAPPQKILEKEIKKICKKASGAYDGLKIRL